MDKWNSRKVITTGISVLFLAGLPILYKRFEISDSVSLLVVGAIASLSLGYSAANVAVKKIISGTDQEQ